MLVVICGSLRGIDMTTFCTRIRKSLPGQTATEYVLLRALIAVFLYSIYMTVTGPTS
jgi:Flp pilus assembly pilin Flp